MHVSVLKKGESIKINQCRSCCDKYHCPFCETWVYKPRELYSVAKHVEHHLQTAIEEDDFIIIRCNLKCRDDSHFHCFYCSATVLRKAQFKIHLTNCKQKKEQIQSSQRTAAPLLQVESQPSPSEPHTFVSSTPINHPSQSQVLKIQPLPSPLSTNQRLSSGSDLSAPLLQVEPQPSPSEPNTCVSSTPINHPSQNQVLKIQPLPSLSTNQRLSSGSDLSAPLLQVEPSPSEPQTFVSPKDHVPSGSKQIRVKCIHCGIELNKKNLRLHIRRKHTEVKQTITSERHFLSQCIDSDNGIFAVQKSFFGPSLPIHVQKRTWGANHRIKCEVDQCNTNTEFAFRSGLKAFECDHIKSLAYCPRSTDDTIILNEEVLKEMVEQKWFGEDRKKKCIERQRTASILGVPLSVEVTIAGPSSSKYISVYEPKMSYYSRLGRVIVGYDSKKIRWSCPCNKTKQSCVHKAIAKWHLFQTQKSLFRKVRTTERTDPIHKTEVQQDTQYPPNEAGIKKMVLYLLTEKLLPADLPKELINGLQPKCEFPRSLVPQETFCSQCKGKQMLSEPILITSRARILTFTGVVEGK
ncbi:uncharacterized protein [Pseudorasbora parva]|uniref:uncharacterized protein n=1 Tax=Pseudorasbora parva TaxID=51549 RepID=UPI00351E0289